MIHPLSDVQTQSIGDNTVIAAGSVVSKNIPPNVVAGGIPARVINNVGL